MTANRSVKTGLTASAVISVRILPQIIQLLSADTKIPVLALVHCPARLLFHRLQLRCLRPLLVCRRLQSDDCVFRPARNLLQAQDPRSPHLSRSRSHSIWYVALHMWTRLETDIRLGRIAHFVFMVLCLVNNIFASANMLLGASAVISAMYVVDPLR